MIALKTAPTVLSQKSDCLLWGMTQKKGKPMLRPADKELNRACGKLITGALKYHPFTAAAGEVLPLFAPQFRPRRIALVGLGDNTAAARKKAYAAAFAHARRQKANTVTAALGLNDSHLMEAALAAANAFYQFQLGGAMPKKSAHTVYFVGAHAPAVLRNANAAAAGAQITRHLAEQPGNICHPEFLARAARGLHKKLKVSVLTEKQLRTLKMEAFLSVAAGSVRPPRLIILDHRGGGKAAPIVLAGKGVTFDSGGISIKPAAAMDEMKFDMCGAATVFGVLYAAAQMHLPLNIIGVVPCCENMPDGEALKPGDIVTAMNGKTIEVQNTDAEGRLILADALCYIEEKFRPAAVVDIATLTGACIIALGHHCSGLVSRSDSLAKELLRAGKDGNDECWRLPLGEEYQQQLKSDYADLANIGGRPAGTITAACFLSNFVRHEHWAHLDIAGTAWNSKKRATARPLPLLLRFLMNRAGAV